MIFSHSLNSLFSIIWILSYHRQCILNVSSFPSQAGHCNHGDLSDKNSLHGQIGSGSLYNSNLQVQINSIPLEREKKFFMDGNKEYNVKMDFVPTPILEDDEDSFFKGFLFRLSGLHNENVYGSLSVNDDDKKAQVKSFGCSDYISAVTHTNADLKSSVELKLEYVGDIPASLLLEVTVVVDGKPDKWFYDKYQLEVGLDE